eukprot:5422585-Prymnesium_polylepis.1
MRYWLTTCSSCWHVVSKTFEGTFVPSGGATLSSNASNPPHPAAGIHSSEQQKACLSSAAEADFVSTNRPTLKMRRGASSDVRLVRLPPGAGALGIGSRAQGSFLASNACVLCSAFLTTPRGPPVSVVKKRTCERAPTLLVGMQAIWVDR